MGRFSTEEKMYYDEEEEKWKWKNKQQGFVDKIKASGRTPEQQELRDDIKKLRQEAKKQQLQERLNKLKKKEKPSEVKKLKEQIKTEKLKISRKKQKQWNQRMQKADRTIDMIFGDLGKNTSKRQNYDIFGSPFSGVQTKKTRTYKKPSYPKYAVVKGKAYPIAKPKIKKSKKSKKKKSNDILNPSGLNWRF